MLEDVLMSRLLKSVQQAHPHISKYKRARQKPISYQ